MFPSPPKCSSIRESFWTNKKSSIISSLILSHDHVAKRQAHHLASQCLIIAFGLILSCPVRNQQSATIFFVFAHLSGFVSSFPVFITA